MASIKHFEHLEIWQLAREQARKINQLVSDKKLKNDFSLISQITASSGSVMDNIAEGFDREGNREFIQFLSIAKGSNAECRSQVYRCFDNSYITQEELEMFVSDSRAIGVKIKNFMDYLRKSEFKGQKFNRVE